MIDLLKLNRCLSLRGYDPVPVIDVYDKLEDVIITALQDHARKKGVLFDITDATITRSRILADYSITREIVQRRLADARSDILHTQSQSVIVESLRSYKILNDIDGIREMSALLEKNT